MKKFTTEKKKKGLLILIIMALSVCFSTGVFAANIEISDTATIGNAVETDAITTTNEIGVEYRGHVENKGDMPVGENNFISGPEALGTRAQSLRVEGFMIKLIGDVPEEANIVYEVHVQNEGWMSPVKNGDFAGTRAKCQRVESIKINLENLPGYDVYYRGHVQDRGDIPQVGGEWGWVKNGEELGTTASSLRLEEIQIKIVKRADVTYAKAGTYGPKSGIEVVNDNITIDKTGVVLQNMHIKGNLTIGEGVGEGDVTLNNITVDGETFIRGGGKNSIHINGGEYNRITVQQTSSNQVRIVATNSEGLEVVISEDAKGEDIILEGAFENVQVDAPDIKIQTQGDTSIKEMNLTEGATGSQINLDAKTTVTNMNLDAKADIKGAGTIANANVNADNVTFEKAPEKQTVAPEVAVKPVIPAPKPVSDGFAVIPVADVTVNSANGVTVVAIDQEPLQMGTSILPENATYKSVVWTVQNGTGTATISKSGVLTGTGIGKVTVIATNPSSGITATKEIAVITSGFAAAEDIDVPGLPGLNISDVSISKTAGKINIYNQIPINAVGNVVGEAVNQLNTQVAGIAADPTKGYVSYTLIAPNEGELSKIVAYQREPGEAYDSEFNIEKNLGSAESKGYANFYEVIAEKTGENWKTRLLNGKVEKVLWYYADGTIIATRWSVSSVVTGSIERDNYNTGGDLTSTIVGDVVNFTSGEITWYPENTILGSEEGNRVGVKITAPTGFDPEFSDVYIGNHGYHWSDLAADKNYFYWYPLVTESNHTYTAEVIWGPSSKQVFTVNTVGTTLEAPTTESSVIPSTATIGGGMLPDDNPYKWVESYDRSSWDIMVPSKAIVTGTVEKVPAEMAKDLTDETHLIVFGIRPQPQVLDLNASVTIIGQKKGAIEEVTYTGKDFTPSVGKVVVWGVEEGEDEITVKIDWDGEGAKYSEGIYTLNLSGLNLNTGAYSGPYLDTDSHCFYGNGEPLVITGSIENNQDTVIYWKGGSQILKNTDNTIKYTIFGGAKDADADSSHIMMNGGTVDAIYGGGNGSTAENSAEVKSALIDITGGTVTNCVYGGAKNYGVTNSATVLISKGNFNKVCGGGEADAVATQASGNTTKATAICVFGGKVDFAVYGGPQGNGIVENSRIEVSGGDIYDICAGGVDGLTNKSEVTISGSPTIKRIYSANNGLVRDVSYGFGDNLSDLMVLNLGNVHEKDNVSGNGQVNGTVTVSGTLPTCYIGGNLLGNMDLTNANGNVFVANQYDSGITELTVQSDKTWIIGSNVSLTIPVGLKLTNQGIINNNGTINNYGTIIGVVEGNQPITLP